MRGCLGRLPCVSGDPVELLAAPCVSIRSVAAFVAVAETGSFVNASKVMFVDASTVSKLVGRLEKEVGAKLLRRSTRCVTVTPPGEGALVVARRLLREALALQAAARSIEGPT
jgi:DNA-binding transcriptional LysR family regulator